MASLRRAQTAVARSDAPFLAVRADRERSDERSGNGSVSSSLNFAAHPRAGHRHTDFIPISYRFWTGLMPGRVRCALCRPAFRLKPGWAGYRKGTLGDGLCFSSPNAFGRKNKKEIVPEAAGAINMPTLRVLRPAAEPGRIADRGAVGRQWREALGVRCIPLLWVTGRLILAA